MPLIPPNFSNTSSAPPNKPPWARGPASNNQQGGEAPWRKNVKFAGASNNASSEAVEYPPVVSKVAPPSFYQTDQQPKTSTLQINLKSVKKPDTQQPLNLPQPVQYCPVVVEHRVQASVAPKAPPGKVIPILIQQSEPSISYKPTNLTTTIPIQPLNNNDPPLIKTETKVKLKTPVATEIKKMPQQIGTAPPPAPPPPPGAPPPPPPPSEGLTTRQLKVEMFRKAHKKRPDWAGMMKEIEKRKVLNHVECDDRSKPMLSRMKSRGRFVYESEAKPASKKDALHNRILNEITKGVKLKKVHCDDRSRPILRGFRMKRQGSQIEGEAPLEGVPVMEPVEELAFLDIDVLRDELQSAKQLLDTEIDSKLALERKTRDQKCQIISMEAEIEALKAKLGLIPEDEVSMLAKGLEKSDSKTLKLLRKSSSNLWKSPSSAGLKKSKSGLAKDCSTLHIPQNEEGIVEMNEIEEEIVSLKEAVQHAKKQSDEMEAKYKDAMAQLQVIQDDFEESEKNRKSVESKLTSLEKGGSTLPPPIIQTAERTTQTEEHILENANVSRQQSHAEDLHDASEEEDDHSDIEVDEEAVQKKKQERELILWDNKLKSIKDKQHASRLERKNLKGLQKKLDAELKDANKRHKKLQKEVDKMAKMLKEVEKELECDDDEDEEVEEKETKPEEAESEEEESEEEESESESDDDDEDSEDEDDEDALHDERLAVYGKRVKRRENVLMALRKGNYLLRANIDRLKDELEEARITYHDLEHDLKAVLEET